MITHIHAGSRGVRGLAACITHDQSSADERQPTSADRVGLVAGLNMPTDDPHLCASTRIVPPGTTERRPSEHSQRAVRKRTTQK